MSKTLATRMAFGDELLKIAETNPDFVVCNADTKTCGLEKFGKRFPEREFSFGIAEQDLVGGAAGLAACGNKVFLATFATFASMRACEQVRTFVCYPKLNVSIIGTHTGLQVGGDGATHAAIEDVAILRAFPNMTIVQPADAVAARALAHAAVEFTGPLYIRLHRNPVADVYDPESYRFELGKAHTVLDYGTDLTMIVSGILLKKAIDAAAILREKGIGARVLDMATIKPLDRRDPDRRGSHRARRTRLRCCGSRRAGASRADGTRRHSGPLRRVRRPGADLPGSRHGCGFHRGKGRGARGPKIKEIGTNRYKPIKRKDR